MGLSFNKYAWDGEQIVREVAQEIGIPWDMLRAYRILQAVLHTLRDRLSPPESLQLIARLPMLIKSVYVDGWEMNGELPTAPHPSGFVGTVRKARKDDFDNDLEAEKAIRAVFKVLKQHFPKGEAWSIEALMPEELRELMPVSSLPSSTRIPAKAPANGNTPPASPADKPSRKKAPSQKASRGKVPLGS